MRRTLVSIAALGLGLSACKEEKSPTTTSPAASASTQSAEAPANQYGKLERSEVNKRAVRLNLTLCWTTKANKNGAIDPAEVTTLLFYPTSPKWVEGGKFTKEFDDAYAKLLVATGEPKAGLAPDEATRRKLVVEDLDAAAAVLVP